MYLLKLDYIPVTKRVGIIGTIHWWTKINNKINSIVILRQRWQLEHTMNVIRLYGINIFAAVFQGLILGNVLRN